MARVLRRCGLVDAGDCTPHEPQHPRGRGAFLAVARELAEGSCGAFLSPTEHRRSLSLIVFGCVAFEARTKVIPKPNSFR
jgi:hypothetical protein